MSNFLVQYFIPPVTQRYTIKTGQRTPTFEPILIITRFAHTSFEENNREIRD